MQFNTITVYYISAGAASADIKFYLLLLLTSLANYCRAALAALNIL